MKKKKDRQTAGVGQELECPWMGGGNEQERTECREQVDCSMRLLEKK